MIKERTEQEYLEQFNNVRDESYDCKGCGIIKITGQEFINMIGRSIVAKRQEDTAIE